MSHTPEYHAWQGMRDRCSNKRNPAWEYYGGRGITVCSRWSRFENFISDVGRRPPQTTIERINNNGNYEPGNVRWATKTEQTNNRRPYRLWRKENRKNPPAYLGEDNFHAKLTDHSVRRIRNLYNNDLSLAKIAVQFGVCESTIGNIVRGKTWKHVK